MRFVSGRKNGLKISTLHQFVMAGLFVDSVLLYTCTGRVFWPEIFKAETAFYKFDFPATKERQGHPRETILTGECKGEKVSQDSSYKCELKRQCTLNPSDR